MKVLSPPPKLAVKRVSDEVFTPVTSGVSVAAPAPTVK